SGLLCRAESRDRPAQRGASRQREPAANHGGRRPIRSGAAAGRERAIRADDTRRALRADRRGAHDAGAGAGCAARAAAGLSPRADSIHGAATRPLKEIPVMKIKANGISINYQLDGPQGAPWLVLSNSLATNLTMWDEQARELGRAFRVLRYDQRGHGGSEATGGRYTFDLLIADVLALMDALAVRKAHFAGLSMGGATALGLAQQCPHRLDRVVVCDSPCQSTPASSQQWEERITIAQKQGMEALVEPTMSRWFPPEVMQANPPHLDK